ncbi:DNA replication initiation factor cdc45 [Cyanidiococcus yangmingshanensis]|uniref:DNA replication initiation factor cdc45 n=1 Tax=Cyanidiococcus yangmingshanensis TaxID=2690220 RepID=A0A7J7IR56_9RHOD|nr:DNA replication initiation factor cdc45 [Cyanidiococcus yangmingshanensis]
MQYGQRFEQEVYKHWLTRPQSTTPWWRRSFGRDATPGAVRRRSDRGGRWRHRRTIACCSSLERFLTRLRPVLSWRRTLTRWPQSASLTLLHQADSLPYHVYPIQQYSEIARLQCNGLSIADQESDQRGSSLRAIFFINCGAGVDVGALLNLPAESDLPLFVLDAHRPYHLRNLESAHVIVLHDSDVLDTRLPDSGYEDILGRVPPSNANADDHESSASDLDSTNGSAVDERRRHRARHGRHAVQHYYQRTRRAATSAGVAYALAANLNRATVDTLWCWILAVTEQFLNRQAGDQTWYDQLIRCIREEWKRLTCRRPVTGAGQDATSLPVLEPSEEFSLELLRHWTLYDSLLQSSWLAVRIRSWRQHAERRVSEILAMLGISLRDSRQHWMHMAAEQKDVVRERLVPVLHAYFEAGSPTTYWCAGSRLRCRRCSGLFSLRVLCATFWRPSRSDSFCVRHCVLHERTSGSRQFLASLCTLAVSTHRPNGLSL